MQQLSYGRVRKNVKFFVNLKKLSEKVLVYKIQFIKKKHLNKSIHENEIMEIITISFSY